MKKYIITVVSLILFYSCYQLIGNEIVSRTPLYNENVESHYIKGIDVSHHQGPIDWKKVKSDSIKFVFIKSTEGKSFVDKRYSFNSIEAKKVGLYVGAYHYFKAGVCPNKQFKNFKKNTPISSIDLPPVIDLEFLQNSALKDSKNKSKFINDLRILEKLINDHYGVKPIFYTTRSFYELLLKDNFDNEIWICHLDKNKIDFLYHSDWNIMQYSFKGKINGINGDVDLDFFKGSFSDFKEKYNISH